MVTQSVINSFLDLKMLKERCGIVRALGDFIWSVWGK
jgi:hypothetical protein